MLRQLKNFATVIAVTAAGSLAAQTLKIPAPSPLQTIKQAFALSDIGLEYSRPSAKNRKVFTDVVPYGKIWRTGANGATKIMLGEDVKIEGIAVPTGTYALYTIPNKDSWEIMLYKDLTLGGNVEEYKKENEILHVTVKATTSNDKTETFTMDIADLTSTSANIQLKWENTVVAFKVVADIDAKIMKNIENTVVKDSRPYFQAASYYYDTDKDLKKAEEWIELAMAQNPKAFWMVLLKAKIQVKQNKKKEAVASANQVIVLAKEAKNDDYVKMAEKLIAENK